MKTILLTLVASLFAISAHANKNYSGTSETVVESAEESKEIIISLEDEGWTFYTTSSKPNTADWRKTIYMKLASKDGSKISKEMQAFLVLKATDKCQELGNEIKRDSLQGLAESESPQKVISQKTWIPNTTLNLRNKEFISARCIADFVTQLTATE